ncbi:MAG TPA: hypothetical protein VIM84_15800 [Gemmatimonadales bacterium]
MIFRAEVSWDNALTVGGTLGPFFGDSVRAALYFEAKDAFFGYGIGVHLNWHSFGGGPTYEYQTVFEPLFQDAQSGTVMDWLPLDDGMGGFIRFTEADGQNGAAYSGGTLAIEKDTEAETIRWSTPLGSTIVNWADLGSVEGSPLLANQMGHQFDRAGGDGESEEAQWYDFFSKQDGEIFHGAELSTADPGVWGFWLPDTTYGGSGSLCLTDNVQLTNRYQTKFMFHTVDGLRKTGNRELRSWAGTFVNRGVDLTQSLEQSVIWRAASQPYKAYRVRWGRTHDQGRHWDTGTIYEEVGKVFSSPSLTFWMGRLIAVWSDGSTIYQAQSYAGGQEWEVPLTLPYTGTNPRHIVEWRTGLFLYFFFDGADLKVARSTDYGHTFIDAAPVLVEASVGAQQIDAEFAFDNSCLVTYFISGAWTQKRSYDMGASWQ